MAENTTAARRQARRRRILENSQNRLRKITGTRENGSCENIEEQDGYSNGPVTNWWEEEKSHSPPLCAEHTSADETESYFDVFEEHLSALGSRMKLVEDADNSKFTDVEVGLLSSLAFMKLHFICLAIFVRILYLTNYGFLFGESLLVPFFIVEITSLTVFGPGGQRSSLFRTALILSGVSSHIVEIFTKYSNLITSIGKDFAVYFTTFILFHIGLMWII